MDVKRAKAWSELTGKSKFLFCIGFATPCRVKQGWFLIPNTWNPCVWIAFVFSAIWAYLVGFRLIVTVRGVYRSWFANRQIRAMMRANSYWRFRP